MRVKRGLYVRPVENRYVGKVMPEPSRVVRMLAKERKEKIAIHGAEAALWNESKLALAPFRDEANGKLIGF